MMMMMLVCVIGPCVCLVGRLCARPAGWVSACSLIWNNWWPVAMETMVWPVAMEMVEMKTLNKHVRYAYRSHKWFHKEND
jgi:hypothetical protein